MSSDPSAVQGIGLPSRGLDDLPGLQTEDLDLLRGSGNGPTPGPGSDEGEVPEEPSVLVVAAALRFPDLRELQNNHARITALLEYISDIAVARGDLEELRLEAHIQLKEAEDRLAVVNPRVGCKSRAEADRSRREIDRANARVEREAAWVVKRCTEQIDRFIADYDSASRSYTLLSGG